MNVADVKRLLEDAVPDTGTLQEIRFRVGRPIILWAAGKEVVLSAVADSALIKDLLNICARHSLYAFEDEIRQGFLTIEGGHRVGIVGKVVLEGRGIRTIKEISGLNLRLAHACPGCADLVMPWLYADGEVQNTLFLSPPGAGKTTMLRDVIRQISDGNAYGVGQSVSVVDERSELGACFRGVPQCDLGMRTDVMDGCPKALGMTMVIRSMSPRVVAVDEVGTMEDLEALREVMKCGCKILATVHGSCVEDLRNKRVMGEMVEDGMFSRFVVLTGIQRPGTIAGVFDGQWRLLEGSHPTSKGMRAKWPERSFERANP